MPKKSMRTTIQPIRHTKFIIQLTRILVQIYVRLQFQQKDIQKDNAATQQKALQFQQNLSSNYTRNDHQHQKTTEDG